MILGCSHGNDKSKNVGKIAIWLQTKGVTWFATNEKLQLLLFSLQKWNSEAKKTTRAAMRKFKETSNQQCKN